MPKSQGSKKNSPTDLTPKQKAVFDYLRERIALNGFSPSLQEMAVYFNRDASAISRHLKFIAKKGWIERKGARAIKILRDYE